MSDEQQTTAVVKETKTVEVVRGERGAIGEATSALTFKQRYHEAHFQRVDTKDNSHPNRKTWVKNQGAPSLKQYARKLLLAGDANAKDWFEHKRGSMNAERSEKNIADTKAIGNATKLSRKAKK